MGRASGFAVQRLGKIPESRRREERLHVAKMLFRLPQAKRVIENPTAAEVKELAAKMPTARPTKYGNLNVQTEVLARSKRSTYLVTDEPDGQNQSIPTDEGVKWAERQDEYIAGREMVQIDGYIGN